MKTILRILAGIFFLFSAANIFATDVLFDLKTAQLAVGTYSNRTMWIQPMSVPTAQTPSVVLGQRITAVTDSNGQFLLTNAQVSLYHITVTAPPSRDDFSIFVTATDLGTVNASDILVASASATFPAGTVAWAAAVSDQRYARGSNQPVSFSQVTNALGFLPQPSSINLSNWSLFNTNVLSPLVNTSSVVGIGKTNWVAHLNDGSTNQILLNPSLTNGVNFGNAFSSRGATAGDEQFGLGATSTGGGATAVGNNANATGAQSLGVGFNSDAEGLGATALGDSSSADAAEATAVGFGATVTHAGSTALGWLAISTRPNQVMLGTASTEVNVPGQLSVAGETNSSLTANKLVGADANKKLIPVTIGAGLSYDIPTKTLSVTAASTYQTGSANLTNWSLFDTNVLTPIPTKTGTNDVIGIGNTNWVRRLNGGSTNQVLLNPNSTNLVNSGNAIRSPGTTGTDDQFGTNATANGVQALAVGNSAIAQGTSATALGPGATAQGDNALALGPGALALNDGGIAIGVAASALHTDSIVIGPSATSSRPNQITLGNGEEVFVPGNLSVSGGVTNGSLTASRLTATDANKRLQSVTLGNGLTFSGSTLSLNTDSSLSTSGGSLAVVGSAVTGINATHIATGLVPTARLGSGTANSSTFLRGDQTWATITTGGTVTSVALAAPSDILGVTGSPVTGSGTLTLVKQNQSANRVFAGPTTGSAAAPTFRILVENDIPSLSDLYWSELGNPGTGKFLGTTDNSPLIFKSFNTQVGYFATGTETLGGPTLVNVILGDVVHNEIGSGAFNCAILSGQSNSLNHAFSGECGDLIAGGMFNTNATTAGFSASDPCTGNTISGGCSNVMDNVPKFATIPGGFRNYTRGSYSFAAGRRAHITNQGAFVWADSQDADANDNGSDSFTVRAQGGIFLSAGGNGLTVDGVNLANGSSTVSSDQNSSSSSLGSSTLSVTLAAGKKYTFDAELFVNSTVGGDGFKIDFGGGSATATAFRAQTIGTDSALKISSQTTTLTTAVTASTFSGQGSFNCHGYIQVNAGGTFIIRFAQASHSSGVATVYTGSYLRLYPLQ